MMYQKIPKMLRKVKKYTEIILIYTGLRAAG